MRGSMLMMGHRLLVKFLSLSLLDYKCSLRAFSQAGTKPIAVLLAYQFCLTIYYLKGPFRTGRHAKAAAIALLFINLDYFS